MGFGPTDPSGVGPHPLLRWSARPGLDDPRDPSVAGQEVELARGVDPEGENLPLVVELPLPVVHHPTAHPTEAPDPPGAVIGVEVMARERRQGLATVDEAAR